MNIGREALNRNSQRRLKPQNIVTEDIKRQEDFNMAKIDISKIDGYADMTPEQKIAALEAL